jgi:hypothetical protein
MYLEKVGKNDNKTQQHKKEESQLKDKLTLDTTPLTH